MFLKFFRSVSLGMAIGFVTVSSALAETAPKKNPVGLIFAKYDDPARANWNNTGPRPLVTAVWYPAPVGIREKPWRVYFFDAGENAIDAPLISTPAKLPLILISHGTFGSAATMAWLAESLAAHGYLVAAVNHHGNTGYEASAKLEGFIDSDRQAFGRPSFWHTHRHQSYWCCGFFDWWLYRASRCWRAPQL